MLNRLSKLIVATGAAASISVGAFMPRPASADTTSTILTAAAAIGAVVLYSNYQHKQAAANTIVGYTGNAFQAIDYHTGKSVWRHVWPGNGGSGTSVLTTASGLIFTGDTNGNFVAMDAANGDLLWHSGIGNISAPPETYRLDGHQFVLASVGDAMFSFVLN